MFVILKAGLFTFSITVHQITLCVLVDGYETRASSVFLWFMDNQFQPDDLFVVVMIFNSSLLKKRFTFKN